MIITLKNQKHLLLGNKNCEIFPHLSKITFLNEQKTLVLKRFFIKKYFY